MKCSVVVPAFNAEATVVDCLRHVLAALGPDDDVVVVDDGSSDRTAELAAGVGPRVQVVRTGNGGPGRARNIGVARTAGELIAFCDADDLWRSGKLARQRGVFVDLPATGICCTDFEVVDGDGRLQAASAFADRRLPFAVDLVTLLAANPVCTSSVVMTRQVFSACGGFPEHLRHSADEDVALWIEVVARHPAVVIPEVLLSYRVHAKSLTAGRNRRSPTLIDEVRQRRIGRIRDMARRSPSLIGERDARLAIAEYCYRQASNDWQEGRYRRAARYLLRSLRNRPDVGGLGAKLVKLAVRRLGGRRTGRSLAS